MYRLQKIGLALVLCMTLSMVSRQEARAQGYVLVDLGTLGGSYSFASGINDQGQVVGSANLPGDTVSHPVWWDANQVLHDLGLPSGWSGGGVSGINNLGHMVGYFSGNWDGSGLSHAFYWDSNRGLVDLGSAGWQYSIAFGINDSDQIIGSFGNQTPSYSTLAFLHNGVSSLASSDSLGLLSGWAGSYGAAINNAGLVAGSGLDSNGQQYAFFWDSVHGMQALANQLGGIYSTALAINDAGDVVGQAETTQGSYHPYVYRDGAMSDLGVFDSSPFYGANALDSSGQQIVGWTADAGGWTGMFLWKDGSIYDLNHLVRLPSGYTLADLGYTGINNRGQIATNAYVGSSTLYHAVLLDPIVAQSLTITPSPVTGCKSATGKVTLSAPAVVDAYVELASQNPNATVPSMVKILAGHNSATFPIKTTPVSAPVSGQITAFDGVLQSAPLTVLPIGVKAITLSSTSVVGGNSVTGKVTLECPAAPGAITVTLSSSNPAVANPTVSSITIPAGSPTGTFTVATNSVSANTAVTIQATANGKTKHIKLTVIP